MKTRQSASFRAGLIMPVARFNRKLHNLPQRVNRVSKGAGVYISAVVEYLIGNYLSKKVNYILRLYIFKLINSRTVGAEWQLL